MTDQRTDAVGLNIMQRVFDALSTDIGRSVAEIAAELRIARDSVHSALYRLGQHRALEPAERINGVWLYRRKASALRPIDRRGGGAKRQMMQEAA